VCHVFDDNIPIHSLFVVGASASASASEIAKGKDDEWEKVLLSLCSFS
jgi:hypothetical protein